MTLRGWAGRLLLVGASGVFALTLVAVAGEVAVRKRERSRATVPGTMPTLFYRHGRLRHALVRDFDYYSWIHVNRQGFRGGDVVTTPDSGVIRLMAVGGSTTMDGAVSPDERAWPARLEYWLNELDPAHLYEVINAGVSGYRVLDNLIRLQTELYRFRPDAIILYQAHNDLFAALSEAPRGANADVGRFNQRPGEIPTVTPWRRWFERHSLLYSKLMDRWLAIRFRSRGESSRAKTAPQPYADALDSGAVQFERDLAGFLALARNLGVRVVVPEVLSVGGPGADPDSALADSGVRRLWNIAIPFAPQDVVRAGYRRYDSTAQRVSAVFDAMYIPTSGFGLAGDDMYAEGDALHFNVAGSDVMGRELARALLAPSVQLRRRPRITPPG